MRFRMISGSSSRRRRRPRPCQKMTMEQLIVVAVCCFHSSLFQTAHPTSIEALSVPRLTRTTTSPISMPSRTTLSILESRNIFDNQIQRGSGSCLFMAPQTPQPRRPRRMLKKRTLKEGDGRRRNRNRRNRHAETSSNGMRGILPGIMSSNKSNSANTEEQDYRPLVASIRRDSGEDYWIDPKDLEREQLRKQEQEKQRAAFLARKGDEVMPQEKLMTEVKAPYQQNWIGYFSLMVALLSIIVSQFPELLEPTPTIRFPDL